MELVHGTRISSKLVPEDVFSNMPDIVITNILDRLPLKDAVRTGVLSRNWRFKWTMLSQLIFDGNFYKCFLETKDKYHVRVISRILLHLRGAITKFDLFVDAISDAEDINNWILFLSRKGINDLTLKNSDETPLKLPTHLFSCFELKHLKLDHCCFHPPASFHGFPNLLSLELRVVFEENIELGEFFTRCPLLEKLTMDNFDEEGELRVVDIAKHKNLKVLSLQFYDLDNKIFELLGSLPKLQELDLVFVSCKLIEGGDKKRFYTAFPCLKVLKLSKIGSNTMKLSCAFELIRSLPNLRALEIRGCNWNAGSPPQVDYNTTALLQLRSVMFKYLNGSENELWLIKYLLDCSPFLKRIVIHPWLLLSSDEKLMLASKLLKLHRASTVAEIDLVRC